MEINILPFDRDPAYPPHPLLMHTLDTRVVQVWDHWYTQEDEFHPSPIYYRLSLLCFFTYTHLHLANTHVSSFSWYIRGDKIIYRFFYKDSSILNIQ